LKTRNLLIEAFILFRRNAQAFAIYDETLSFIQRIEKGARDEGELREFFQIGAKACNLTKNSQRGINLLLTMKELNVQVEVEEHFN